MSGWKYYNHAMIPTCAPHEEADASVLKSKSFWKEHKGAYLARWTTDFDCGYETNWWYVVKEGQFSIEDMDPKARKHVRQALKKTFVKQIKMDDYAEELSVVHNNACKGYVNFSGELTTADNFRNRKIALDCWGIFSAETEELIGYMTCLRGQGYVETITAKYDPHYLNLRGSDAVHYAVLDYYLNRQGYPYVCSGSRTVNHETHVQDYKISTFGFRKAYCILNIKYRPSMRPLIFCMYPFRKLLRGLGSVSFIRSVSSVLKMEELKRESTKLKKRKTEDNANE